MRKNKTKWMLVLLGVVAFMACAVECRANPFSLKNIYNLEFDSNGVLVVSFRSAPLYSSDELPEHITLEDIAFWAEVAGSDGRMKADCDYRSDEIMTGTAVRCSIGGLDETGGSTMKIGARAISVRVFTTPWNQTKVDMLDDTFFSPPLHVPTLKGISEGGDVPNDNSAPIGTNGETTGRTTARNDVGPGPDNGSGDRTNPGGFFDGSDGCALAGSAAANPVAFLLIGVSLVPLAWRGRFSRRGRFSKRLNSWRNVPRLKRNVPTKAV